MLQPCSHAFAFVSCKTNLVWIIYHITHIYWSDSTLAKHTGQD